MLLPKSGDGLIEGCSCCGTGLRDSVLRKRFVIAVARIGGLLNGDGMGRRSLSPDGRDCVGIAEALRGGRIGILSCRGPDLYTWPLGVR